MIANQAAFNGVNSLGARLNGYQPIQHPVRQPMQPVQANMPTHFAQPSWGPNPQFQQFGYRPPQAPVNPYPMSPIMSPYIGFGNSVPVPVQGGPAQNPDQPQQLNAPLPVRDPMQRPVIGRNSLAML